MKIKAASTYDLKAYKAFIWVQMFKRKNPKHFMILYLSSIAVLSAIIIAEIILLQNSILLWCCLGVLLLLAFSICFQYFFMPKISYKQAAKLANANNEFTFTENTLYISSSKDNYNASASIDYSMFFKVMETSEYFFIFQNKQQACIADKSTIQNGTAEDIRRAVSYAIGKNYILCNY